MLVLHHDRPTDAVQLCTGTLLAPALVLTARHCVTETSVDVMCGADGAPLSGGEVHGKHEPSDIYVFAGTERPRSLSLERAVPNPFHPRTALRLDVRRAGPVAVRVHGPGGRLVRTLFEGSLPAGSRRIDWDGRDDAGRAVASGVYLFVASTAGERVVRKATLLQ